MPWFVLLIAPGFKENPDKLEMSYGKLVPILVKEIQELKVQLDNKQDK